MTEKWPLGRLGVPIFLSFENEPGTALRPDIPGIAIQGITNDLLRFVPSLVRSTLPAFEIFRGAVVCPEGAGAYQPGAECNAAPGGGGDWFPSPEGATQTDPSIV